jgi:transcriptional regulator with PAS, ATPase and Fis domain
VAEKTTGGVTEQTSRSEPERDTRVLTSFLVIGIQCDQPLVPSSRHTIQRVDEVTIGRGVERRIQRRSEAGKSFLSIALADRRLSQVHARMLRDGKRWVVEDLESTNGSFVRGERFSRHVLEDGDVVELGRTLFLYREIKTEPGISRDFAPDVRRGPGVYTLNPELEAELDRVEKIAVSQVPLLIFGETGTGKEVVARAVHAMSERPGDFIAVNCGALPASLVESQLFGHVKGAFSGAVRDETGFVRAAHRGTLFLDEIGDLPQSSQVALLRVLQSGEVTPLGSTRAHKADIRVVCATHRSLDRLMEAGEFRRDLYARLAGFTFTIPPLRERLEDLGMLTPVLLSRLTGVDVARLRFRVEAARALYEHSWPLNVRELEQALSAASVLAEGGVIGPADLPASVTVGASAPDVVASPASLSAADVALKQELEAHLAASAGNLSEVARRMGKARQQVQRWIKRFALDPASYR